ncbi:hypothetical protein C8Q74DRAFT_1363040 [Fomes fomentarius]|nr:hypothetical protein C8Q74DRAFT_1363040 [Fomes fomentarius]
MNTGKAYENWQVAVSSEWAVLGPFPIHAREQHFLSPSFPVNLSQPIDLKETYPSSYADGGSVSWTTFRSREDGTLEVSFPEIRWESLRATEGWAALQHHSLLRSTLTLYPPSTSAHTQRRPVPRLAVNLNQGSFFAIRPQLQTVANKDDISIPEWHSGNIYALARSPPNFVDLPSPPSLDSPTTYDLVVSGDYEIRLFGDPSHSGTQVPTLSISLSVDIETTSETFVPIIREPDHDISCDFVGGWAFGDTIGVGVRSLDGWWAVIDVSPAAIVSRTIELSLVQETSIAPTQTRIVPIKFTQTQPVPESLQQLEFSLKLRSGDAVADILVTVPIEHHESWTSDEVPPAGIKASYFFGTSIPTAFLVKPPKEVHDGTPTPPILALHGAGVDIFTMDFWIKALPRQRHSWIIAPTGRTEWGLDWHGPSAREAFATVDALYHILNGREHWRQWGLAWETKVLLMGHSNGGQGAWFNAARNPDRVVGVVPAAGYIKSQAYVPWTQSRSAHYIDPAVRAVLDSSLTPDDNDLFLSNLVDTPVLGIHGGDDDNVPVWHTRESISVLKTWSPQANATFREDPGQPHWYDTVFANDQVESFVSQALEAYKSDSVLSTTSRGFTLTVAVPADSGSLHGWTIHRLAVPGRLARLTMHMEHEAIRVGTANVKSFSLHLSRLPQDAHGLPFIVDGQKVELDEASWELPDLALGLSHEEGAWVPYPSSSLTAAPPTGRIANFLTTSGPVAIVVPARVPSRTLSAALRIAHNLNVYHKLDVDIITDDEAIQRLHDGTLGTGNLLVLANGALGEFAKLLLSEGRTAFGVRDGFLELRGRLIDGPSQATLFLHPHPLHASSLVLFLYGADAGGLERGLRLFPIRTGVTVPDWIVVGPEADERGSGGVKAAGVWGNDWGWNEAMSAF